MFTGEPDCVAILICVTDALHAVVHCVSPHAESEERGAMNRDSYLGGLSGKFLQSRVLSSRVVLSWVGLLSTGRARSSCAWSSNDSSTRHVGLTRGHTGGRSASGKREENGLVRRCRPPCQGSCTAGPLRKPSRYAGGHSLAPLCLAVHP